MSDVWDPETEIEENRHNWSDEPKHLRPLDTDARKPDQPKLIDLFCGPGGISTGLAWAGFDPVLGVDIHEPSIETYQQNHPGAHAILGDIRRINKRHDDERDIFEVIESDERMPATMLSEVAEEALDGEELGLLTAGIPCQGFSIANRKQHDQDERNYLFEEFIRGVRLLDPKHVLIENVSTMKAADDGGFVEAIEECLDLLGYDVDHRILNAADFGVPQKRRRLFFLGTRTDAPIIWPQPTHEADHRSTADALADLPPLEAGESASTYESDVGEANGFQKLMREGTTADLSNHEAPNHRQTTIDRVEGTEPGEPMYDRFRQRIRLHPDEPGPTIIAGGIRPQFQYGHYDQSRGLSVRERARLQSFPDGFTFAGGTVQGRVQTGMAVPPLLAKRLGEAIRTAEDVPAFVERLTELYGDADPQQPWHDGDATPYEVLVGEVLARNATGGTVAERDGAESDIADAYRRFIEEYPNEGTLAEAGADDAAAALAEFEVDEAAAKQLRDITSQVLFAGIPESEDALLALPHVDERIANAVLCFGAGERYPVVTEEIAAVYSRFFGLDGSLEDEYLWEFARAVLPAEGYVAYNRVLSVFAAEFAHESHAEEPDALTEMRRFLD